MPELFMYEIEHTPGLSDWIIAYTDQEATRLLEDFHESYCHHRVSYAHCKVTKLSGDVQTMTARGLMTVRQIIEHYGKPHYVKAG